MRNLRLSFGLIAGLGMIAGPGGAKDPAPSLPPPATGRPAVAPTQGPVADNSRCLVCHANYEDEPLSVAHAKANLGCVRCHGVSSPHSTDEDGLTAP